MKSFLYLEATNQIYNHGSQDEIRALNNINLEINRNDFVVIIGSNGSGKSSLLNAIGYGNITSGNISLEGFDITLLPGYLRSKVISTVTQRTEEGTAGELTILENLILASNRQKKPRFRMAINRVARNKYLDKLTSLGLNLDQRIDSSVDNLSGGERQIICVLMALIGQPSVLLCDEPTASIDVKRSSIIENMVSRFSADLNIPVLWVTHDPQQVLRLGNRLIVMDNGEITEDIFENQKNDLDATQISHWIRGTSRCE